MPTRWTQILVLLLSALLACHSEPAEPAAIGEAYVGPFELDIIQELSPEAPVVATLRHGERVEVMAHRRRFTKVRTAQGVEGWTDGRLLLTASHMARLRRLSMSAARLRSEGKATVYDALNVHTDPNRQAPSFYQLQEGNLVEVLAHQVVPRGPYEPPSEDDTEIGPLNSYDPPADDLAAQGPVDDWTLVRLRDGRAGWTLTRMLSMAIPDEVAQYAEGDRITAYASLGAAEDGGQKKHHWLWTTLRRGGKPYQFDSFRVFVWSVRRHRYETAYRERNLVGYYPVEVLPKDENARRNRDVARFALILRDQRGDLYRQTYGFSGYRVRLIEKEPWEAPYQGLLRRQVEYIELPATDEPSVFQELVDRVTGWFEKSEEGE